MYYGARDDAMTDEILFGLLEIEGALIDPCAWRIDWEPVAVRMRFTKKAPCLASLGKRDWRMQLNKKASPDRDSRRS